MDRGCGHIRGRLRQQPVRRLLEQADGGQPAGQGLRFILQLAVQRIANAVAGEAQILVGRVLHPLQSVRLGPARQLRPRQGQKGPQQPVPGRGVGQRCLLAHAGQPQHPAAAAPAHLDGLELVVGMMGGDDHAGAHGRSHVGQCPVAPFACPGFQPAEAAGALQRRTGGRIEPPGQEAQPQYASFIGTELQPVVGMGLQTMVHVRHHGPHGRPEYRRHVHQHLGIPAAGAGQQHTLARAKPRTGQGIQQRLFGRKRRFG